MGQALPIQRCGPAPTFARLVADAKVARCKWTHAKSDGPGVSGAELGLACCASGTRVGVAGVFCGASEGCARGAGGCAGSAGSFGLGCGFGELG